MTTVYLVEKSSSLWIPEIIYMNAILLKRKIWEESLVFQLMFFSCKSFFCHGKKDLWFKKTKRLTPAVSKTKHAIKSFWTEFFLLSDNKKESHDKGDYFLLHFFVYINSSKIYELCLMKVFCNSHQNLPFFETGPGPCLM